MRPHIICHMVSSVDGKIDGESLRDVMPEGEYERIGTQLKGEAWICGRTTMQQHFAEPETFVSKSKKRAGPQPVFVARKAKSYPLYTQEFDAEYPPGGRGKADADAFNVYLALSKLDRADAASGG